MEQFFLRAVKTQLPVKANTDLSHRPALVAESLSLAVFTMAFLSSVLDMSLCGQNKDQQIQHSKALQCRRSRRWQCVVTVTEERGGGGRGVCVCVCLWIWKGCSGICVSVNIKCKNQTVSYLFVISWLYLHRRSSSSACAVFKAVERHAQKWDINLKKTKQNMNFDLKAAMLNWFAISSF